MRAKRRKGERARPLPPATAARSESQRLPSGSRRIAKLSFPKLHSAQPRRRLFERLAAPGEARLTWICGPPGAGKTTLIATYLQPRRQPVLWYRIDGGDADPATVFYYLRRAAMALAHRRVPELPLLTPEYRLDLAGFAQRFFRDLFAALPRSTVVVLDSYQDAASSALDAVLLEAVRSVPDDGHIFVTSRTEPPADFEHVGLGESIRVLRRDDLRLQSFEVRDIATAAGIVDNQQVELLTQASDGWAAGLRLLIGLAGAGSSRAAHFADAAREALYRYFAAEFFSQLPEVSQRILLCTSVMPTFTAEQAVELSGAPGAGRFIGQLYQRNFFIDRRQGATATFQYHALFRSFLREQAANHFSHDELTSLRVTAARLLELDGQLAAAIALYNEAHAWEEAVRVTLTHGPQLIQQGRHQALEAWISDLPAQTVATTPWLQFWRGIAQLPFAPARSRTNLELAYQGFDLAGDSQACVQACTAILYGIFLEWGDQHESDRWLAILEERLNAPPIKGSAAVDLQILPALTAALLRHLGNPFVAQVIDRAYERVSQIPDTGQRVAALGAVSGYFAMRGQVARGQSLLESVVSTLHSAELTPLTQLNLLACELVYAHFVFEGAEYAANQAKVDRCLQLSESSGVHLLDVMIVAQGIYLALKAGDLPRAERLLVVARAAADPSRVLDQSHVALLKSAVSYTRGDFALAHQYALECLKVAEANGHTFGTAQVRVLLAHALWSLGRAEEAREAVTTLLATARAIDARGVEYVGLLLASYFKLEAGEVDAGLEALRVAFGFGKLHGQMTPTPWCDRNVTHRLCEVALPNGIETEFVCRTIEWLRLPPRRPDIETWPWPVRIYTLGPFRILLHGVPVESFSKQQRRPLGLLKALIAMGGRNVKIDELLRLVWQSDAEDPRAAFDMATLRLRKLLGHADALLISEGRVTLNEQLVWVDARALEARFAERHKRRFADLEPALALYRGHFLAEEGEESWVLPMRDRLASMYRAEIRRAARELEASGQLEKAATLYEMGLQVDNLSEEFYRELMRCLQRLDRTSDALNVYHRCRHILSVVLRVRPSPETEQLHQRLIQS